MMRCHHITRDVKNYYGYFKIIFISYFYSFKWFFKKTFRSVVFFIYSLSIGIKK